MANVMSVSLVAADREVWSGEATVVNARTLDGEIGIMANHTPIMSVLDAGQVDVRTVDGGHWVAAVDGGFLSQNTYVAKQFTGIEGSTVSVADTIEAFNKIADGDYDHVAEQAFFMCGGLDDVEKKWAAIQAGL